MAYLPPGFPFLPPPPPGAFLPPPPTRPLWPPSPPDPSISSSPGEVVAGVSITFGVFLLLLACVCSICRNNRQSRADAEAADAAAAAAAVALWPRPPASAPEPWRHDDHQLRGTVLDMHLPWPPAPEPRRDDEQLRLRGVAPRRPPAVVDAQLPTRGGAAAPESRPRRASAATAGLPSFRYSRSVRHNVTGGGGAGEEAATCSVCLGAFESGEMVRLLPVCLHLFHVECIDPWVDAHATCPLCRSGTDPTSAGLRLPPV